METRNFLEKVLPLSGGDYFGASVGPNSKFSQSKLDSIDALTSYVTAKKQARHDVYFATGVYDDRREAQRTQFKKALYVDIDVGEGKPYDTKKEAVTEIYRTVKDSELLRPSILVDSGNGIHAYWVLDNAITLDEWVVLATALERLCAMHNLDVDSKVTSDAARILRVPGTSNYKGGDHGKPASVLKGVPYVEYTIDQIRDSLDMQSGSALAELAGLVGDDLSAGRSYEDTPRYAAHMVERCKVFEDTIHTGGAGQQEPLWMHQLQILAFCEDGDEYIHTISDGHDNYDFKRTAQKYAIQKQKAAAKRVGPIKCSTLALYKSEQCKVCPHNGAITTPLQLGVKAPDLPYGWKQDDKAIYRSVASVNDAGITVFDWEKAINFTMHDVEVYGEDGDTIINFTMGRSSGKRELAVLLDDKFIKNPEAVLVSAYSIPVKKNSALAVKELLVAFMEAASNARSIKTANTKLGWHGDTFVLPEGVHSISGTTPVPLPSTSLRKMYTPTGSRDSWIDTSHKLTALDRQANNALIVASFAAPLISMTKVSSALFSVYSPESGTGKSTSLKVGQAVWGDPVKGTNSLSDTPNSVINKLGYINNLPAYWDEVQLGKDPRKFIDMIFQLTQGKERSRLTTDISQREVGSWHTMLVVATNSPLMGHADAIDTQTTASKLRIFEVRAEEIEDNNNIDSMLNVFKLEGNFGHIGVEYASWLASHKDEVKKVLAVCGQTLEQSLNVRPDERFWIATCTAMLAAAHLSVKLGYTKIDVVRFKEWLIGEYKTMRSYVRRESISSRSCWDWVSEYLGAHAGQLVITERLGKVGKVGGGFGKILHEPAHGAVLGVKAGDTIRLHRKSFVDWMHKNGGNHLEVERQLKESGATTPRTVYTGGMMGQTNARVACLEFRYREQEDEQA